MITPPARRTLELVVLDAVVLDLDREPLDGRVHRRAFRHRPRAHHAVHLEPDVEVVGGRLVLLHDEHAGGHPADRELLVALDTHCALGNRAGRAQRGDELVDRGAVALRVDAQRAVLHEPHPTKQAELHRARAHVLAQPWVVHVTGDGDPDCGVVTHPSIVSSPRRLRR